MTDPETIKAMRSLLRRVDEHDQAVAHEEGAQRQSLNMLDVVYHPTNPLPNLNYITPRRGAAWVSTNAVQQGLERLAELGRAPRLLYFEGLMPPIFRQSLAEFGLQWAGESSIFATSELANLPPLSPPFTSTQAAELDGLARWWHARNEMLAGGLPRQTDVRVIERMARMTERGQAHYMSIERQGSIVGLASLRIESGLRSAEINAFHHAEGDLECARALMTSALRSAAERDCDLVFTAEAMADQAWLGEFGFSRLGSVVAFAARLNQQETFHDRVAQPLQP
jgi:N-acetylglutamate synthase-like GNAT family acetyltransferase